MRDIFAENGVLASHLAHFEARSGQLSMAEAVADLLQGDQEDISLHPARVLVVEAETGIGKTLAYLIPAILSSRKIVISTATLNLQDQILNKEIPLIEKVLDQQVPVLCVKGRQNYLCHYRWFQYRAAMQMSLLDDPDGDRIEKWLEDTTTGDRSELAWLPDRSALWPKISAQSSQCLGGDCPESAFCFINQLRRKAGSVRLLIVNHHLFFSDLALRSSGFGEVLPRYEGVIFDEAHHIENVATQFFGRTFSQYQLLDLFADLERQAELDLDPAAVDVLRGMVQGLSQRLDHFLRLFPEDRGRFHLDALVERISDAAWRSEIDQLSLALERLQALVAAHDGRGEGWGSFDKRVSELKENLQQIALPAETGSVRYVHWYERRERTISLSATPVEIAGHLRDHLYGAVRFCVMTSATLSSGGSFAYVKDRLGLDDQAEFLRFNSPFDYRERTLLYIPETSFPEPTFREYQERTCERVLDILRISRGRALVLFTSLKAMDLVADFLDGRLSYPVLVQGRASRQNLLDTFRNTTDSVLLAVASFWEGVDVAGESLSCVIIDKLPFEVPSDPVLQARIRTISDNGGNPFFDLQVPRAILSLRQGAGRLMRSATDRGVIAILDVRLFSKGYGRIFLKSLPPSPVVRTLQELSRFFGTEGRVV
jgi:ATP-dependent DNA helicase DinG